MSDHIKNEENLDALFEDFDNKLQQCKKKISDIEKEIEQHRNENTNPEDDTI